MKNEHRFELLDEALEFIKSIDNETVHGYKIIHEDGKWYVEKKAWTPFGMKYKWKKI